MIIRKLAHIKIERADGTVEDLGERTIVSEWLDIEHLVVTFDPWPPKSFSPISIGDTLIVNDEPAWVFD